jgi:hypothetical protein
MLLNFLHCITNLFSNCWKYQDEPVYKKIVNEQKDEYYYHKAFTADPLWQDRRLLSFYSATPNVDTKK